jgi:VanZ family protein
MRRTLPLLYIAFILLMVVLADTGTIGFFVQWIHAIPYGDKACHALFAFGLGLAVDHRFGRDFRMGTLTLRTTPFWLCPLVLLEECSQLFIPGRTFDLGDLLADAIGLTLGFVVSSLVRHRGAAPSTAAS